MPTIVLADDHPIVRQGLRALLTLEGGYQIIGESDDGVATLQLVERICPDFLILDMQIPGLSGIEVTRSIQQRRLPTHVIILSMYADESYVLESLRSGAMAYVLKDANTTVLLEALREVAAGRRYLGPPLADLAIDAYLSHAPLAPRDRFSGLTSREREVLVLVGQGFNNSVIADQLGISPRTVETHRTNLLRKLNLGSQAELIRVAALLH